MNNLGRTAAIIAATLLVAVTPVVAFADAGPKNQLSITESQLLDKVNTMMGGNSYEESNHGGIVSFVAQKDLEDLIEDLGLTGDKITRGQIIRVLAGSDAGKANKGKSEEAKANKGNSEDAAANTDDSDKDKKDKDEKVVGQARADANRAAAAAAATARQGSEDDEETDQGRGSENRQGANSHGNATRTTDGVTDASDDEPGSQGQGRGNGNQNR